MKACRLLVILQLCIAVVCGRIHNINIVSDRREIIPLANFGLTKDGFVDFQVTDFIIKDNIDAKYGIVVESSQTQTASQYVETHINICRPESIAFFDKHPKILNLLLDKDDPPKLINEDMSQYGAVKWDISNLKLTDLLTKSSSPDALFKVEHSTTNNSYSFHFQLEVKPEDEGQFTFYFYRCPREPTSYRTTVDYLFSAVITAKNGESFLSAGEKPLTFLYTAMGIVYFGMFWLWMKVMIHYSDNLFKIHYLMAALVFAKFLACILHAIDYYFIASHGTPDEAWAILWYIIHLVRGMLLFISLALIGMGFAFIKHVLSYNEKLVLMTVVPLQILANVAYIIIDSSEEAELNYGTWKKILIFVDLLCCGAIIFPVMWSIRHLQQATERSDNKTTLVLSQLKLFRHFYILVVVYIYITRIALKFMEVVLPFQLAWCTNFMDEIATIAFFLITGWNFRPYISNPYYKVVEEDDEMEMESMIESDTLRNRTQAGDEDDTTLA